jgi:hypothetical protein
MVIVFQYIICFRLDGGLEKLGQGFRIPPLASITPIVRIVYTPFTRVLRFSGCVQVSVLSTRYCSTRTHPASTVNLINISAHKRNIAQPAKKHNRYHSSELKVAKLCGRD